VVVGFTLLLSREGYSVGNSPLRAAGEGSPAAEEEITRKLADLQGQIDRLKEELAQSKKTAAEAAAAKPESAARAATAAAAPAAPEEKKVTLQSVLGPTSVSGFVDGYYSLNFNHPRIPMATCNASNCSSYRVFDAPANQFSLNYAKIQLDKTPDAAASRLGYRLSFGYGNGINVVNAFEPGGLGFAQYMEEAYLSYLAPVGKNGLQVDFGKFVTPHGAEVIESKDNWNYSRGILFGYAIPFYHFGIRSKYSWNSKVALSGFVVNGWNNVIDNNTGKTYGVSLSLNPSKKLAIAQNYMAGPEMTGTNQNWRQLSDTIVTVNATDKLSFIVNYDYGRGDSIGLPDPAHWQGVAGYMRYAFDGKHAFAMRYEWYDDPTGFTTGAAQQLKEFTGTFEKKIAGNLISRLEYRHDYSNQPTLVKGDSLIGSQDTLAAGLIYVFDSKE
ncbi:MAG: porin, partial [Terriglobia bacterium]